MINIDSIRNGIVIDHIKAGKALEIYKLLHLEHLTCSIAIIKNVSSKLMGKKDIIKIADIIDLDLDAIAYVDNREITVNFIENGVNTKKFTPHLPNELKGVIECHNPRCITSIEDDLEHIFKLTDIENRTYRCYYCESKGGEKL